MGALKRTALVLIVSLLMLGAAWVPAQAYTVWTITAETPPVVGRFSFSFTDHNDDGIYTPTDGDQFIAGSLVWSGGWSTMPYTVLVLAPANNHCQYTNDNGGDKWYFGGPGLVPTTIGTDIGLTYTETKQVVPCPPAALLLASGLLGLAAGRRRKGRGTESQRHYLPGLWRGVAREIRQAGQVWQV